MTSRSSLPVAASAAGVTAAILAACVDILTAGFGAPSVVALSDTIVGTIEAPGEEHKYGFRPAAGDRVVGFLEGGNPAATGSVRLEITAGPYLRVLAAVEATGADSDILEQATDLVEIERSEVHGLRVASRGYTGRYRAVIHRVEEEAEAGEPEAVQFGAVVEGTLSPPGDVDVFTFDGAAGSELNTFFQARSGKDTDSLVLGLYPPFGGPLGLVASAGDDPTLEGQVMGRVALDADGRHTVRVEGLRGPVDTGPYRFKLFLIDRRPESRPAAITLSELVEETLDPVGDVDEFTFTPGGGRGITTAVFQGLSGSAEDHFTLTIQALGASGPLTRLEARGSDTTLDAHYSGRFETDGLTTYLLRVEGENSRDDTGSYRFQLSSVDPAPESRDAAFALGDTVGEAIDALGDIDEFNFSVPARQHVNVFAHSSPSTTSLPLVFTLNHAVTNAEVRRVTVPPDTTRASGRTALEAGAYRVRVNPLSWGYYGDSTARYVGDYAFQLVPIDTAPEHTPSTIAIGDTIAVEDLEPAGDLDVFQFPAQAGQLVTAYFENLSTTSVEPFVLWIGQIWVPTFVAASYGTSSLATTRTRLAELPATGTYAISVYGAEQHQPGYGSLDQHGPYRFYLRGISRGPEIAEPRVVLGDTVATETIFIEGDVDEFVFSGTVGQEFVIFFRGSVPHAAPHRVDLIAVDSATDSVLGSVVSFGYDPYTDDRIPPATGRFALPRDGDFLVRVWGSQQGGDWGTSTAGYLGGYEFQVFPIDPAPELVSSVVAIGDTVTAEVLHPMGDVDEFEFDGVAGDSISISGEITDAWVAPPILEDLTTGSHLWGPQPDVAFQSWSQIVVLPSTGRYRLRLEEYVSVSGWFNSEHEHPAPYRFWITR